MKFSIKNPTDHTPIVLDMIPEEQQGQQVLKIIFPEKQRITMVKKNGIWGKAAESDLDERLIKAISRGIHVHIRRSKIYSDPIGVKPKTMKKTFYPLLLAAGIALTACPASRTDKKVDSLLVDSTPIDTTSKPIGGVPDTLPADTATIKKDQLHLDTI